MAAHLAARFSQQTCSSIVASAWQYLSLDCGLSLLTLLSVARCAVCLLHCAQCIKNFCHQAGVSASASRAMQEQAILSACSLSIRLILLTKLRCRIYVVCACVRRACGMLIRLQSDFGLHKTPTTFCGSKMAFKRPVLRSHIRDDRLQYFACQSSNSEIDICELLSWSSCCCTCSACSNCLFTGLSSHIQLQPRNVKFSSEISSPRRKYNLRNAWG